MGKLIGQFKSFAFASINRTTIPGLQRHDVAVLNGALSMVALGSMVYIIRQKINGREVDLDPGRLAQEGIDRSGVLGAIADGYNLLDLASRGTIGAGVFGGPRLSRYSSRSVLDAFVGPTAGLVQGASQVAGSVASGPTRSDIRAARRLLPYQNLSYMSWLFDAMESGMNEELGIPESRRRRRRR